MIQYAKSANGKERIGLVSTVDSQLLQARECICLSIQIHAIFFV